MNTPVAKTIGEAMDCSVAHISPLSGGCIAEVYRAELSDGRQVAVKYDGGRTPCLDIEGFMLKFLAEHSALPVPQVLHSDASLLVMNFMEGQSQFSGEAQAHAATVLSELHAHGADQYGLEQDTLIGPLHQPNPWTDTWLAFFREHRLLYMADLARQSGNLSSSVHHRIQDFALDLDKFIEEPKHPALLHGDVWTTNVLAHKGKITGFIDPAIYYGHPEIELAFITLFHTFGDGFFQAYREHSPIAGGFFEVRRDIYLLYPLLVHATLFGGGYARDAERTIAHLGY
jgi:fructosamine-3-kinase